MRVPIDCNVISQCCLSKDTLVSAARHGCGPGKISRLEPCRILPDQRNVIPHYARLYNNTSHVRLQSPGAGIYHVIFFFYIYISSWISAVIKYLVVVFVSGYILKSTGMIYYMCTTAVVDCWRDWQMFSSVSVITWQLGDQTPGRVLKAVSYCRLKSQPL